MQGLSYYGGRIISEVKIIPIFWNERVLLKDEIDAFYNAIVTGGYLSFFQEYNTFSQNFSLSGLKALAFVDNQTSNDVADMDIQRVLEAYFESSLIPTPSANNLYVLHFPPGTTIMDPEGSLSCHVWCGYHYHFRYKHNPVYYVVLPDLAFGTCALGCGSSLDEFDRLSMVASHEFADAITEPGSQLSWYDMEHGEVADLCNLQPVQMNLGGTRPYTVQKLWSNLQQECVSPQQALKD